MNHTLLTIAPQTHRFFNELATAQAATAAYGIGHLVQAGGTQSAYSPNQLGVGASLGLTRATRRPAWVDHSRSYQSSLLASGCESGR